MTEGKKPKITNAENLTPEQWRDISEFYGKQFGPVLKLFFFGLAWFGSKKTILFRKNLQGISRPERDSVLRYIYKVNKRIIGSLFSLSIKSILFPECLP